MEISSETVVESELIETLVDGRALYSSDDGLISFETRSVFDTK